jgi:DNA-binding transcriptional LysR family regulator
MHFRQLKTFLAVAETLSFTRASEQVHLAQSSVTEQIQALEADLGAALFDRTKRRLRLTEAGKRFCAHANDLLMRANEARLAVAETAGHASGQLMIGGLETLCAARMPTLLASFRQAHPTADYRLKVANSTGLRNLIQQGALDIGFGYGDPLPTTELEAEIVGHEHLVAIAPPGHRLRSRRVVGTGDLAAEAFLVTGQGCIYRAMFERAFSAHRPVRPTVVGEFGSLAAIRSLVANGVGCALLPHSAVADRTYDELRLPLADVANAVPVSMFWHRRRTPSPLLDLFLVAARDFFSTVMPIDAPRPHAQPSP